MKYLGMILGAIATVAVVFSVGGGSPVAQAANSCTITNQTPLTLNNPTSVSWTWGVDCSSLPAGIGYTVYTDAQNVTQGHAYGNMGTGTWPTTGPGTSSATETKTIPTCVSTDNWYDKVTVRDTESGSPIVAGPVYVPSSAGSSLCPVLTGPTVPTGLAANPVSSSEIDLTWNASTDQEGTITGYDVYRNGIKVTTVSGTSFNDTGLTPSTQYAYTVDATDGTNTSAQSAPVDATTQAAATGPTVPTGLAANPVSTTEIDLSWNPSTDGLGTITGYDVYRNGSLVTTVAAPATTFNDTGLTPSTQYSYTVDATDGTNTSAQSAPVLATTEGTGTLGKIKHIVTILEENHSANLVTSSSMPFLVGKVKTSGETLSNEVGLGHPSLPNYLNLTEGNPGDPVSFYGQDCGTSTSGCIQNDDNIYHQAEQLPGSWAQWSESMPSNCDSTNKSPYVVHHAPAPFYQDLLSDGTCATNDIPITESSLPTDSAAYTFVTPNLNDNAHDGTLAQADNWLSVTLPQLMGTTAYKSGNTLIEVTFDETGGTGGSSTAMYTALFNPNLPKLGGTISPPAGKQFTHYSVLAMNEHLFNLPYLAGAQTAAIPNTGLYGP